MQTQLVIVQSPSAFSKFEKNTIQKDQLLNIKGGNGDTPPDEEGYIGIEDIVNG